MPPATVQDLISRLQVFWASLGCLQLPAVDQAISSGTLAPQSFLRLRGPEPWRAARLQWVRQPGGGRYGRNDLRSTRHLEYQLLIKPAPRDIDDLYLKSLKAAGFELNSRNLELREDRYQQPVLAVAGIGWRVLLDGIPVSRITLLVTLGRRRLNPTSVEVTYGLERLALLQQQTEGTASLGWSEGGIALGEVDWRAEEELSRYYFERADGEELQQRLESAVRIAERCLESGLVLPAYEAVVECAHLREALLARGSLPTAADERLRSKLSELASGCAEAQLERRRGQGFPLLSQPAKEAR